MVPACSAPGLRGSQCEVSHSPPSSSGTKNAWRYTSNPRTSFFFTAFNEEAAQLYYLYESSWPIMLSELLNVHLLRFSCYYQSQRTLFMVLRVPCNVYEVCLRQPTLPLRIRINTGSLYRNVSLLNYKRDKGNVS